MYTHRKILTLTRRQPRPKHPLTHALDRAPSLTLSFQRAPPSATQRGGSSPPRAAPPLPLLPLPLHRRGGRGPSPSPLDPAKSMAGALPGGWIRRHHLHADDRADPIVSFVPPLLSSLVFVPNCILIARIGDHRASTTTTRRS